MIDESLDLTNFNGVARLFPLPNLVFFPHAVQPLHIFEPRYRHMTADALASDRLIALVMLQDDWDKDYQGKPAIHPVATLGRIMTEEKLADGRYNFLLQGLVRVRIHEELATDKLYREARVEILHDQDIANAQQQKTLREELAAQIPQWFPDQEKLIEQFTMLLEKELPLGVLTDVFTFALLLDGSFKQALLEELDVVKRARALIERMGRKFPPAFSSN